MDEKEVVTQKPIWLFLRGFARAVRLLIAWKEEHGRENIPLEGMLFQHCSHFTTGEEAGIIFDLSPRRDLRLIYKKELESGETRVKNAAGKVVKYFLRGAGFIPTERGVKDGGTAVAQMRYWLRRGHALLAMPERTSRKPALAEAPGKGTALLAMELDCPVQPIAVINGPDAITDGFRAWFRLRKRHKLYIFYGLPFRYSRQLGITRENDPTGRAATDACMVRIAAMLPKKLRGFYTEAVEQFLANDSFDVDYYRKLQTSLSQID